MFIYISTFPHTVMMFMMFYECKDPSAVDYISVSFGMYKIVYTGYGIL